MSQHHNDSLQILSQDLTRTLENAVHFFQGKHENLPELLKDAGTLLVQASKKLTAKQVIIPISILAVGAIVWATVHAIREAQEDEETQAKEGVYEEVY